MKVYITISEDFESGEEKILGVFKRYEKARNSCIDNANLATVNTDKYVELDHEREGEYLAVGVYQPMYDNEKPEVTRRYFVITKQVVD